MLTAVRDIRHAVRSLGASPAFALTTLLTLALAIGANAVVFTVVDRVLLRPLPLTRAEQVVAIYERHRSGGLRLASYPAFLDWQQQATAFAGLAFARGDGGVLQREDGPEHVAVAYVSPGYFDVLGAGPMLGRAFLAEEERASGVGVAVLSHRTWRERFGSDRAIVGRRITLDDVSVTVVGVLGPGAHYPLWADLWLPIAPVAAVDPVLSKRDVHVDSRIIGRLADGVTLERARADVATIQARLAAAYGGIDAEWIDAQLTPLRDEIIGNIGPTLLLLGGAVALVLIIACTNIAGLSIVRASVRQRELAIRAVLGATRLRLARYLLTESMVLGLCAALLGLLMAAWVVALLERAAPPQLPRAAELTIDLRVATFAVAISALAAVLVGLAPLLRRDLRTPDALHGGRYSGAGGHRASRLRGVLASSQLALSVVLLVGAGLLVQSLQRVRAVDLGFDPAPLMMVRITPPEGRYPTPALAAALYRRLVESLSALPGVTSAAVINHPPLTGGGVQTRVVVPGRSEPGPRALYTTVSDGYLRTTGIALLRGRWFTAGEIAAPGNGIVISDALARRYWPDGNSIGQPVTIFRSSQERADFGQPIAATVIGVVASVRHFGIEAEPEAQVYVPYTLETWSHTAIVVRVIPGRTPPLDALRSAVLDVDPAIPVAGSGPGAGFERMTGRIAQSLVTRRYGTGVLTGFAICALLLAVIGVYGILASSVAHRTREIGIRLALGATPSAVVGVVLNEGVRVIALGIIAGTVAAAASSRVLRTLLYDTSPLDITIFVLVPATVLVTALVACLIPAARAAWTDPTVALRAE